ncbi:ribonuclease M5 [Fusibacter ferrireducens]|uniref:Ribonuclease M5 n=1 Tax=Fusibacter ferrireducens TaxID=2785058 RepID=A0ABR9ZTI4_9FIRM|nr:ribonuclease M5 [Fusibacter ferrireducens]MBF4693271.1 ribonuclease M5 [Fusibacter ferrireducens]
MLDQIKEVIVVEGKDDESAVKRAVDCEIIITHGFGIREETFKRIERASQTKGVIIFTDPDYAGEQIRNRIEKRVKGCKHAFLDRQEATKKGDVGIENASPSAIREALSKVRTLEIKAVNEFMRSDLVLADLIGNDKAADRRAFMGKILGIGYCNAKQFLNRLNRYGVTRMEFASALETMEKEESLWID